MAFSAQDHINQHSLTDSEHVDWEIIVSEFDGRQQRVKQQIKTHKCTLEDWDKFYPPAASSKFEFDKLKASGLMWCMDELDINDKDFKRKIYGMKGYE